MTAAWALSRRGLRSLPGCRPRLRRRRSRRPRGSGTAARTGALAYFLLAGRPPAAGRASLRERLQRDGGLEPAQAGALARFGRSRVLVVSGHNAWASWRRPPDADSTVVAVDYTTAELAARWASCRPLPALASPHHIDNQQDGSLVTLCTAPRQLWSTSWPRYHHNN